MAVNGTYNVEIQTPMGKVTGILTVKAEGDRLTGTYEAHENVQPLTGTILQNNFTIFTAVGDPPQQKKLEFNGKVIGNEITGGARADGSDPSYFRGIKAS